MLLSRIDVVVIGVYAVGIFALAQWVSRDEHKVRDTTDYFLASRALPWWATGASLIAANISAEQIVGMSGSGYAIGLAVASYEWMAALTILIVGKFFLPIFLRNGITTMPQFLEQRYGPTIRTIMAVFWLGLYIFVNLTSILWLGSIAVTQITGFNQDAALFALGGFALLYQIRGGLKAVALTDIVQVSLLVLGGLLLSGLTLNEIGGPEGVVGGFKRLTQQLPEHFDLILPAYHPFYKDLPGISVLVGGMWIANLSYWGFNQYIIQRALAARDLNEAQKGIVFAAFLKLLIPFIVVVPGIAAVLLAPGLAKPDQAYPSMLRFLPHGVLGLVAAALIAAIIASTASKINSIATIFTLDLYAKYWHLRIRAEDHAGSVKSEERLVWVGRLAAISSILLAALTARPLLGQADQAFQYIQEYTGFFTPGIVVIFLLGLFWKGATEAGAIAAALGSCGLSLILKQFWPGLPFLDRMFVVFVATLILGAVASLLIPQNAKANAVSTAGISYATSSSFNLASFAVLTILTALYTVWW